MTKCFNTKSGKGSGWGGGGGGLMGEGSLRSDFEDLNLYQS